MRPCPFTLRSSRYVILSGGNVLNAGCYFVVIRLMAKISYFKIVDQISLVGKCLSI